MIRPAFRSEDERGLVILGIVSAGGGGEVDWGATLLEAILVRVCGLGAIAAGLLRFKLEAEVLPVAFGPGRDPVAGPSFFKLACSFFQLLDNSTPGMVASLARLGCGTIRKFAAGVPKNIMSAFHKRRHASPRRWLMKTYGNWVSL